MLVSLLVSLYAGFGGLDHPFSQLIQVAKTREKAFRQLGQGCFGEVPAQLGQEHS
jgi:hypothetical protein